MRHSLEQLAHGGGLFGRMQDADLAMDYLAELAAAWRHRATIIDARDDVALLSQQPMPHPAFAGPAVPHRLAVRLAIDVDHQWIFLVGLLVEVGWLQAPRIKLDSVADVHARELDGRLFERIEFRHSFVFAASTRKTL